MCVAVVKNVRPSRRRDRVDIVFVLWFTQFSFFPYWDRRL